MATVEYKVCDRCGEKINWRSRLKAIVEPRKVQWVLFGYVTESTFELCGNCSDRLDAFLYPKRKTKGGNQ